MEEQQHPQQLVQIPIQDSLPSNDFWKWALDDEQMLLDFEHKLRGEIFDNENGVYVQKFELQINEVGINELMTDLYLSVPNKSFKLTTLTDEDINRMSYEFVSSLIKKLRLNYLKYGISSKDLISNRIIVQFDHLYYGLLKRSKDNSGMRALREVMQRSETISTQNIPDEKKRFSFFRGG